MYMKGSEEACLAFALFEAVVEKLVKSPLEVSKSRVSSLSCRVIEDRLVISWSCQGTGSSLRKTCALAASVLQPHRFSGKFAENMRALTGKPGQRSDFNYAVRKAIDGLKKGIEITAVGKITTTNDKLKDILGVVSSKFSALAHDVPDAKSSNAPEHKSANIDSKVGHVKSNGAAAIAIADYIRSNSNGMGVDIENHGIVVHNPNWESKRKALKSLPKIKDYVDKKYAKLGDEFPSLFAYFGITQGFCHAGTAAKIIKSKQKPGELSTAINAAL
jgi:hypothetical protein